MALEQKYIQAILETATVAARLAGQKAAEEINFLKVSVKNNVELVTQADGKCQKIIIDHVKESFPDHGFIAEEGENGKMFKLHPRGNEPIWWIIDPIDGTNNFAHKLPLYVVSIAVMYQNEPIVAVVFDPSTDSMFTAVKGGPALLNNRKIEIFDESMDKFASIGMDSHFENKIPQWVQNVILKTRFRNLGTTALHLALVGSGAFIASIAAEPKLWDIAAGALIAQSAGAIITNFKGQKIFPIDIDAYNSDKIEILAANKKVHQKLVDLINSDI